MSVRRLFFTVLLISLSCVGQAAEEIVTFDDPQQSELYYSLLEEYRCLKCQNQNLADSNAGLAGDLRREIREQILEGKTKKNIDDYLVARYGEFVLYRPRFNAKTAVLWIAPFLILAIALVSLLLMIRRRSSPSDSILRSAESGESRLNVGATDKTELSEEEQERLDKARQLLEK